MRADYFYSLTDVHTLEKTSFELPAAAELKGDQIVARTIYSAISTGTELAAWHGMAPLRPMKLYPRFMGYANLARIEAFGSDVSGFNIGDIILTQHAHRSAYVCTPPEILGVFAPDEENLIKYVPSYFYHLGYYPYLRAELCGLQTVAVIGLGTIGLASLAVGKLMGHVAVGISDSAHPAWVAQTGADCCFKRNDLSGFRDYIHLRSNLDGADLVIVTTNSWDDWKLALEVVRNGGTIAVVGFPGRGQGDAPFNPLASQYFYDKEITILSCGNPPDLSCPPREHRHVLRRNCAALIDAIRHGQLKTEYLTNLVYPADQLEKAYQDLSAGDRVNVTAILDWSA